MGNGPNYTEPVKDSYKESYMSSSLSNDKLMHQNYAKSVADFLKSSADKDVEASSSISRSEFTGEVGANLGSVFDQYKKMQELLAKYNVGGSGGVEDSSDTYSRST